MNCTINCAMRITLIAAALVGSCFTFEEGHAAPRSRGPRPTLLFYCTGIDALTADRLQLNVVHGNNAQNMSPITVEVLTLKKTGPHSSNFFMTGALPVASVQSTPSREALVYQSPAFQLAIRMSPYAPRLHTGSLSWRDGRKKVSVPYLSCEVVNPNAFKIF